MANQPGTVKTAKEMELIGIRGQIIGLSKAGKTPSKISETLGVSRATVHKWIKLSLIHI